MIETILAIRRKDFSASRFLIPEADGTDLIQTNLKAPKATSTRQNPGNATDNNERVYAGIHVCPDATKPAKAYHRMPHGKKQPAEPHIRATGRGHAPEAAAQRQTPAYQNSFPQNKSL